MKMRSFLPLGSLAMALALSACGQTEETSGTAAPGPKEEMAQDRLFEREALAIKSRFQDPKKIGQELRDLNSRLGRPPLVEENSSPAKSEWIKEGPALGKAAGITTLFQRKSFNLHFQFANTLVVSVANGTTLTASGSKLEAGLDPILVGFYKTESTPNANAYRTKIVGYVDDISSGDLNSRFTWKNTTGSAKSVRLVVFAYPGTYGKSSLVATLSSGGGPATIVSKRLWVSGLADFEHFNDGPPASWGCTGPHQSRLNFWEGSSLGMGATIMAVNPTTMRGGYVRETTYQMNLDDVLPSGGYNLVLAYIEGNSKPQPDPIFDVDLWKYYGGSSWFMGDQYDRYSCTNPE